jgi:hypothetical protein
MLGPKKDGWSVIVRSSSLRKNMMTRSARKDDWGEDERETVNSDALRGEKRNEVEVDFHCKRSAREARSPRCHSQGQRSVDDGRERMEGWLEGLVVGRDSFDVLNAGMDAVEKKMGERPTAASQKYGSGM